MVKKISAIFLALVLCLSVMVVPVSALELGEAELAFELKWDKEYYSAGDTAVLSVYMDATDDYEFATGSFLIGLNSSAINVTDNPIATVKENAVTTEWFESFWKPASTQLSWLTNTTQIGYVTDDSTAEEIATYDTYLKYTAAKNNQNGWHENYQATKNGFSGAEFVADEPIMTIALVVSESAPMNTAISAAIMTGSLTIKSGNAQTHWKYFTNPGNATTTANVAAADIDVTQAVATATVGVEPCETHTWNDGEQTTAPTCGEAGEMLYTCTVCKSTKTEEIAATGNHTAGDPVDENVVAPSCNTAGSKEVVVKCSVCDFEMSRTTETLPATGDHNYATKKVVAEPTCTETGSYVMVCGCGAEDAPVTVDALGHDFSEVDAEAVAPTCTEAGSTAVMGCSRCDATEGGEEVPATDHDMVAGEVVAPTCTTAGYTVYTCANGCGTTENRDEVEATNHDYESVVTAPTCTEAGYTTYTCPACGDTYTADEVEATDHDYESEVLRTATCTRTGVIKYTCSVCGDNYREDIPSLDHKNADGTPATVVVPGKPATCTSTGLTEGEKCTICNSLTVVQQTIPTTDHGKDNAVVTEPTYSSQGYTTYTCNVCGAEYKDDYVPALSVEFTFEIAETSVTTLRARDSLVLHPVFTGEVAEGVTVVWTADNNKFKTKELDDGSLEINARKNGTTVFTATVYDAEGNEITSDTVEIVSNAKFFGQIAGFFRAIFGLAKYYEN